MAATVGMIAFRPEAEVAGAQLRLGDVADVAVVPPALRDRAAALLLVNLPVDSRRTVLDHAALAARARALMPVLAPLLPRSGGQLVVRRHGAMLPEASIIATGPSGVQRGDAVQLQIRAGAFTIRRDGRALQAAEPGAKLFVATSDRAVIAARCCGEE